MTSRAMLRATALGKSFNGFGPVLSACNLEVRHGEVLAVVGPSGAGKTTLLQLLAGLMRPDQGAVWFDGAPLVRPTRRISVVFQEYDLFPWRTTLRNVTYPLEVARWPRHERRERAWQALIDVGLAKDSDKYPRQLSGGMQQRTAIARAVVARPEVLLLDEPMSALDLATKRALQHLLSQLINRRRLTTVMVTHHLADAAALANRAVLIAGSPASVVTECELDRSEPERARITQLVTMVEQYSSMRSLTNPPRI